MAATANGALGVHGCDAMHSSSTISPRLQAIESTRTWSRLPAKPEMCRHESTSTSRNSIIRVTRSMNSLSWILAHRLHQWLMFRAIFFLLIDVLIKLTTTRRTGIPRTSLSLRHRTLSGVSSAVYRFRYYMCPVAPPHGVDSLSPSMTASNRQRRLA